MFKQVIPSFKPVISNDSSGKSVFKGVSVWKGVGFLYPHPDGGRLWKCCRRKLWRAGCKISWFVYKWNDSIPLSGGTLCGFVGGCVWNAFAEKRSSVCDHKEGVSPEPTVPEIPEDRSSACTAGISDTDFFPGTLCICQPTWTGSFVRLRSCM